MGQVGVDDGGPFGDTGVARHTNPPWSNGREATSHTLPHRGVSCHLFYTVVPSFFTDLLQKALPLGVVQAARDEHTAPTVVASVQTLSRRTRLTRLAPDFQTIVIDEAHHAPAPTYRRILDYCWAWHPDGPLVVGVTATPERGDHHSLRPVFDSIVYQKTLLEMMQAGYLLDLRALQVLLQADFDTLRTQQGDFVEAELESLLLAADAPAQVLT